MERVIPTHCRNGHQLGPGRVTLGWRLCTCSGAIGGGHHVYWCRDCDDGIPAGCVDPSKQMKAG